MILNHINIALLLLFAALDFYQHAIKKIPITPEQQLLMIAQYSFAAFYIYFWVTN